MTSTNNVSPEDVTGFELKHRITGAAVLLIFGVLFLPWLLGSPSEASKANATDEVTLNEELSAVEIEKELLEAIENESAEDEIEVYVSRITPLDSISDIQDTQAANEADNTDQSSSNSETSETTVQPTINNEPTANNEPAAIKEVEPVVEKEEPIIEAQPVAVTRPVVVQASSTQAQVDKPEVSDVEVGWIVQVGVFTDKKGAARVVGDLKLKGFVPSTTIVDTNLGKETGTRVWLGPFAQRVDAAKSITTLKEKTGSDAFIRAYP